MVVVARVVASVPLLVVEVVPAVVVVALTVLVSWLLALKIAVARISAHRHRATSFFFFSSLFFSSFFFFVSVKHILSKNQK